MSRKRPGGNRIWGLCEACHRRTSPFDDEYIAWAKACGEAVFLRGHPQYIEASSFTLIDARPGRFIRAALAGMAAVAENLWQDHPALMDTILTCAACEPPPDLRFLVGLAQQNDQGFVEGVHRGMFITMSLAGGPQAEYKSVPTPSATIHWFPFSLILIHVDGASRYPHVDHTDWLREPADGPRHDLKLDLPTVASEFVVTLPFDRREGSQ